MKVFFVFFVFLFCLPPIILGAFDYYLLSMQWPPSTCYASRGTYCKRPPWFTIHGLWPQNYSGPVTCPPTPRFDLTQVTNDPQLFRMMNTHWPNIIAPANDGFWGHEWMNHGTCTTSTQHDYFETTCFVSLRLGDMRAELQNNGMIPGQSYLITDYETAILTAYYVTPLISCNTDTRYGTNGTVQLSEIRFCVDPTARYFIHCQWSVSRTCGSSHYIAFPM